MKTVLIEYRDNTHSMTYHAEPPSRSYWIREWKYQDVAPEIIEEIKTASVKQVEEILSKLYNNEV